MLETLPLVGRRSLVAATGRLKGQLLLNVPVAALVLGAISIFVVGHHREQVDRDVRTSLEEMAAVERVGNQLLGIQLGMQGYLITGDAQFIESHLESYTGLQKVLGRLEALESSTPEHLERLATLRQQIASEFEAMQNLRQAHEQGIAPDPAMIAASLATGKKVSEGVAAWLSEEEATLAGELEYARSLQWLSLIVIGGGAFLGILCSLIAAGLFSRLHQQVDRQRETAQAIQMSMTEGLVVIDEAGVIQTCNEAARKLLGVPANAWAGKPLHSAMRNASVYFDPPATVDDIVKTINMSAAGPASLEVRILKPKPSNIQLVAFPIRSDHQIALTGLLMRDVTEERELQKRQEAFVYVASHELRTPMTSIMGFSELLLKFSMPEEARKESLDRIYQSSRRLTMILDDLLNVSRIHSGTIAVRAEPVPAEAVAAEVMQGFQLMSQKHRFELHSEAELPRVRADKDKLTQIVTNLVDNAIKYSPRGGTVAIRLRHDRDKHQVVISIADQGLGIAQADIPGLFTTFHRIRRPETETIKGTGLGLYIVKSLVGLMNGEIWVESELDKGTTFSFSLPVAS